MTGLHDSGSAGAVDVHDGQAAGPGTAETSTPREVVYRPTPQEQAPRAWQVRQRRIRRVLAWVPPVVLLAGWQLAAGLGVIDVRFFPAPLTIGERGLELIASGELLTHVWATSARVLFGLPAGAALGVAVGLLLGTVPRLRAMFAPSLTALYSVPKLGIFPLLLLIFGLTETPKIILIALGAFLIVVLSTVDAVVAIPSAYLDAAQAFRASRRGVVLEVILPAILPRVFTGLRLAVGMSVLVVIATEFVNATSGIGYLIWNSWNLFQPAPMYVGIVVSALLGLVATALVVALGRVLMPWRSSTAEDRPML